MQEPEYLPDIDINEFDYELPKSRIADFPASARDDSKLLLADPGRGIIEHHKFSEIDKLLPDGSLLARNSTKVIPARMMFRKETGGRVELLCTDPVAPSTDPQITMSAARQCSWDCIVGGRNVKPGMILTPFAEDSIGIEAHVKKRYSNRAKIEFIWSGSLTFSEALESLGSIPLPPYIDRDTTAEDKDRYQTVYAEAAGSVAAPTAGLHFTDSVFDRLGAKGIDIVNVNLHVGPGTFQPVGEGGVAEHNMHTEQFSVSKSTIEMLAAAFESGRELTATGTTTLRTLESLYWCGVKQIMKPKADDNFTLTQYEPYLIAASGSVPAPAIAYNALLRYMEENELENLNARTQLFIMPEYKIRTAGRLITNYHLPKSTLILLVATFVGPNFWRKIYNEALRNDYRFLSYGDSSLLIRRPD